MLLLIITDICILATEKNKYQISKKNFKKSVDKTKIVWYINKALRQGIKKQAGVAQLVEQLICNQQVGGSSPSTSSIILPLCFIMGDFPSGQRGQTVNLLASPSVVRIHHLPPEKTLFKWKAFFLLLIE